MTIVRNILRICQYKLNQLIYWSANSLLLFLDIPKKIHSSSLTIIQLLVDTDDSYTPTDTFLDFNLLKGKLRSNENNITITF